MHLVIKLGLSYRVILAAPEQKTSKYPWTSKWNVCAYPEFVLHPGTILAFCFWAQKLLLFHVEDLGMLIRSDQRGFPLEEFPLFLSDILNKIKSYITTDEEWYYFIYLGKSKFRIFSYSSPPLLYSALELAVPAYLQITTKYVYKL